MSLRNIVKASVGARKVEKVTEQSSLSSSPSPPSTITGRPIETIRVGFSMDSPDPKTYKQIPNPLKKTDQKLAMVHGNNVIAMGAANAGCKEFHQSWKY